jgi:hypothetical protein
VIVVLDADRAEVDLVAGRIGLPPLRRAVTALGVGSGAVGALW